MIYQLRYDEEPNYEKIKFEFVKLLLDDKHIPGHNNLDWSNHVSEEEEHK